MIPSSAKEDGQDLVAGVVGSHPMSPAMCLLFCLQVHYNEVEGR